MSALESRRRPVQTRNVKEQVLDAELAQALSETGSDYIVPRTRSDIGLLRHAMHKRETSDSEIQDLGYELSSSVGLQRGSYTEAELLSLRPASGQGGLPPVLYLHGGGGVAGSERNGLEELLR